MANTKTTEHKLFGRGPDDDQALFAVRPGEDGGAALDEASTFIDATLRGLEAFIMREEMSDEDRRVGSGDLATLWSLTYTLRMAKALVDSVNSGMPREAITPLKSAA